MEITGSNPRDGDLSFESKCESGTLCFSEKMTKTWNQGPNGRSLIPGMLRSFLQRDFTFRDLMFRDSMNRGKGLYVRGLYVPSKMFEDLALGDS